MPFHEAPYQRACISYKWLEPVDLHPMRAIFIGLFALMLTLAGSAADQMLSQGQIDGNGYLEFRGGATRGRWQNGAYAATPDKLAIQGEGSSGDVSGMNIKPVDAPNAASLAAVAGARVKLVPFFVPAASADTDCRTVDQSTGIQSAIDAAAALGGAEIDVPAGTFCGQGLVIKSGVTFRGENDQKSMIKLIANSTMDLFVTDQVNSCMPGGDVPEKDNQIANCGPVRYGWEQITLDGNARLNTSNPKGRGIYGYGRGMTLLRMFVQNTVHQCLFSGFPTGATNAQDAYDYVTRTLFVRFINCNTSRAGDIPGQAGGGAVYQNGPTDSRYVETFVGWAQGGYSWKFGQFGNGRFIGGEMFGGGYPDGAHFTQYGLVGESRTGTNGTATGMNFGGGVLAQALMRTNGFERDGGKDYFIVQDRTNTSITIGTGLKTFSLPGDVAGGAYGPISVGQPIHIYSEANNANYMVGTVSSYTAGSPGSIVVNVTSTGGSGTFSDWFIGPLVYQGGLQIGDFNVVSSLTSSGTIATATSTNHPYATGSKITISGATPATYNGTFVITKTSANSFTYTTPIAPGGPASGTILSGFPNVSSITYRGVRVEDVDRFGVFFGSSGGYNRIDLFGYTNNFGQTPGMAGAPTPTDHVHISVDGLSPAKVWIEPDSISFGPSGMRLTPTTVRGLPACNGLSTGTLTSVNDAASPSWGVKLAGGGSTVTLALCNGSAWIAH